MLIIIAVVLPWAIWRGLQFNANVSSYRNIRFRFNGTPSHAYWLLLLLPMLLLGIVTLGFMLSGNLPNWDSYIAFQTTPDEASAAGALQEAMLPLFVLGSSAYVIAALFFPYWQTLYNRYRLDQHSYGQAKFQSFLAAGDFYAIYLKWCNSSALKTQSDLISFKSIYKM